MDAMKNMKWNFHVDDSPSNHKYGLGPAQDVQFSVCDLILLHYKVVSQFSQPIF